MTSLEYINWLTFLLLSIHKLFKAITYTKAQETIQAQFLSLKGTKCFSDHLKAQFAPWEKST